MSIKIKIHKDNTLRNKFYCHNNDRNKLKLPRINITEYIEYRKWAGLDSIKRIKSVGRGNSTIFLWEQYKILNNLVFSDYERKIDWSLWESPL